jgi:hypothetical protein
MTPEAALTAQIEKYRNLTGEERLAIALDLHEFACDVLDDLLAGRIAPKKS